MSKYQHTLTDSHVEPVLNPFQSVPLSFRGSAWGCRWSLKSPHSSWPGCGWSYAEIPKKITKPSKQLIQRVISSVLTECSSALIWTGCVQIWALGSLLVIILHLLSRLDQKGTQPRFTGRERGGHVTGGRMRIHNLITPPRLHWTADLKGHTLCRLNRSRLWYVATLLIFHLKQAMSPWINRSVGWTESWAKAPRFHVTSPMQQ